ncbi:MAG: RluA family pseudouridine synthase [Vampirovibrionales bacterium]|nr:RluA family pseudouridine synthase [Vampirovibrionales bacterium]
MQPANLSIDTLLDGDEPDDFGERFTVEESGEGQRLDRWLAGLMNETASRESIQTWIDKGLVTINGQMAKKSSTRLEAGHLVVVTVPPIDAMTLAAEAIPLTVVYEDEYLLVVHKPAGMLTHPAGSEVTGTLVNALLHHCQQQLSSENGPIRPGIVHRLDRDTTGLLMVAKTNAVHRALSEQLQARTAKRQYMAITDGVPPHPSGMITAPIGRNPDKRDTMMVEGRGREAITHWEVLETLGDRVAKVHFRLETGRTHQIRVHAAYRKFPIFGDPIYGRGLERSWRIETHGQCLQAVTLQFVHPISQKSMIFSEPMDPRIASVWEQLSLRFNG